MKILIWSAAVSITSLVIVIINATGHRLGALPTMLICAPMFFLSPWLCKKWDAHKAKKGAKKKTARKPVDKDADFKNRFKQAKAMLNSPVIAVSNEGYQNLLQLENENPDLYESLNRAYHEAHTTPSVSELNETAENKTITIDDNLQRVIMNALDSSNKTSC